MGFVRFVVFSFNFDDQLTIRIMLCFYVGGK